MTRPRERASVDATEYITRELLAEQRGGRDFPWTGEGVWLAGTLGALVRPCVAIVGTRSATPYGKRLARSFAQELASAGCTIVSGLALGIDAAAHEGAIAAGLPTIGILGGGHACFFPRANHLLAERMVASGGAVLSPFPPDARAFPHQFLARNALVAALCDAVLVIEAPARSGALNTANWAAGRIPVLAVPGDVDRRHVAGCHALIRDGAVLARCAADVLEALGLPDRAMCEPARAHENPLLQALSSGECELEEIVESTGLTAPQALAALALLEVEGHVERRGAARFARLLH
jgi:DNA processing protein